VRITRIEPQKRRPGRRNVFVDGEFAAGISTETLLRSGLRTGDEVTAERLHALLESEELASARNAAMRLLARRPRTVREIRDRLRDKEFGDALIGTVLAGLTAARLVDDEQFARSVVADALTLRPAGKFALRRKLLLHGVAADIADRVLTEAFASVDEVGQALAVARRHLQRTAPTDDPARLRSRVAAALGRRGFSWDVIQHVLRRLGTDDEQSGL
jgi:regulatory protein